jgi:hypothetical protein
MKNRFFKKKSWSGLSHPPQDKSICLFPGLLDDPDRVHILWSNVLSLLWRDKGGKKRIVIMGFFQYYPCVCYNVMLFIMKR